MKTLVVLDEPIVRYLLMLVQLHGKEHLSPYKDEAERNLTTSLAMLEQAKAAVKKAGS